MIVLGTDFKKSIERSYLYLNPPESSIAHSKHIGRFTTSSRIADSAFMTGSVYPFAK